MHRVRFGLVVLLASFALGATAATGVRSPWGEPFSTRLVSSEGYQAKIFLPDGWSVDPDQHVLLPADASQSGCRIRFDIDQSVGFQKGLAAGLRHDKESADREFQSKLEHVGGAEAVWVRYIDRAGNRIAKLYVDWSSGQSASFLVWQFEGPDNAAAYDCQRAFGVIAQSSSIKPVETPGTAPPN